MHTSCVHTWFMCTLYIYLLLCIARYAYQVHVRYSRSTVLTTLYDTVHVLTIHVCIPLILDKKRNVALSFWIFYRKYSVVPRCFLDLWYLFRNHHIIVSDPTRREAVIIQETLPTMGMGPPMTLKQ